jgi:hypothetical protein
MKNDVNEHSACMPLLSGGRFAVLRGNLAMATVLVPAFIAGQVVVGVFGAPGWGLCFGLCLGGYTFAIADGIARRRAR